jgi:hypothetical protein
MNLAAGVVPMRDTRAEVAREVSCALMSTARRPYAREHEAPPRRARP